MSPRAALRAMSKDTALLYLANLLLDSLKPLPSRLSEVFSSVDELAEAVCTALGEQSDWIFESLRTDLDAQVAVCYRERTQGPQEL